MTPEYLLELKKSLKISVDQILREEAEMIFLEALAKDQLGAKVIFYGGTSLRLVYGSPRFSEDIDLIKIKPFSLAEFKKFANKVAKNNSWELRDLRGKRQTLFALYFIKDEKLKHPFSIKIEIHTPKKKPMIDEKIALIKSPVSVLEPLLLVPSLTKLKELKIAALLDRKKARDIFDLWYIAQTLREEFVLPKKITPYNKREFKNELQVFLPTKYYSIIEQLYEQVANSNK
ncbi:MAG TPA: nucleotidyl transferase AbiEii/AbiGii toxin family protein [bacterium]|mgnify:CR=1 FL=1|nr:nucleotidyl transferase AbiEii/AbiGii toxin family protein [bacterium]